MRKPRRGNLRRGSENENHYWMSYADLMSALLLVFVLLLMVTMSSNKANIEAKDETIEDILGIKTRIIEELSKEFEDSNLEMEIDTKTGAVRFSSGVFFDYDSSAVSEDGRKSLESFVPQYIDILLSDEFRNEIAQIIVEGHTDKEGSYLYNLELSQERAFSVVSEIFAKDFPNLNHLEDLRLLITSNGRSFMVPMHDKKGEVNSDESRRVEFKFRLKEEEAFEKIQELVNEDE